MSNLYECPRCGTEVVQRIDTNDDGSSKKPDATIYEITYWQCPNCDYIVEHDPTINAPNFPQSSENWSHE